MTPSLFTKAIEAIEKANSEDPNRIVIDGKNYPAELIYAKRLSEWVNILNPHASEALRLAARCQHIRRWESPRSDFPEGRAGYLKWRSTLAVFHAAITEEILKKTGYDEATIEKVKNINLKKNRDKDPDVQTIEDALCLVFLQYQIKDFAAKHEDEKIIDILQKTWKKMSDGGQKEALKLSYPDRVKELIEKAI